MLKRTTKAILPLALVLTCGVDAALGQRPAAPAAPARYKTTLRYNIVAPRDRHVAQYDALIAHLEGLKFEFVPKLEKLPETDREDPGKNELTGFLPSKNLTSLFANRHVASALIVPEGMELPADGAAPVRVRLEIAGGLPFFRQNELLEQVRAVLFDIGFREALGYDQRGYFGHPATRLVGTMPAGQLPLLNRDLRGYPFGWFLPRVSYEEVPEPLRARSPVLIVEALPATDLVKAYTEDKDAVPPEGLEKIDNELWKAFSTTIKEEKRTGELMRVEIFLAGSPSLAAPPSAGVLFKAAPSLFIFGQTGQLVTGMVDLGHVAEIARLPQVTLIRTPRAAQGRVDPDVGGGDERDEILATTGIAELHAKGLKGAMKKGKTSEPVRIAVVDRDFRNWQAMVREGRLPASTRIVDLTRPADRDFLPLPEGGDPATPGHGTQCAMAAALAAPEAEFILVRIPGQTIFELVEVGRYFQGDMITPLFTALQESLTTEDRELLGRRALLLKEREEILDRFRDDSDERRDYAHLGPVFGWLFSDRWWMYDRMAHQEKLEREHQDRMANFTKLRKDIASLRNVQIVLAPLTWPTGYPLGGSGPVARWFDGKNAKGPVWFVPSGNTRGQAWSGLFRDEDGNGVMEFAPREIAPKAGRWTHELAFLRWAPWQEGLETPAEVPVRVELQWREAHDPEYYLKPDARDKEEVDPYAKPQARIDVLLLRQVDPEGKTVGADVFELVARNAAAPVRLEYQPGGAVYSTSFAAKLDPKSSYAVRVLSSPQSYWSLVEVEGRPRYVALQRRNTRTTRPVVAPSLPDLEPKWELRPRLFVETLDPANLQGRMVLSDYATDSGTLGLPAEAGGVVSVGALDMKGKRRPYSAEGPPAFADLAGRPTLYAPDSLALAEKGQREAFGTSLSASLAAGWAAAISSEGFSRERLLEAVRGRKGKMIAK